MPNARVLEKAEVRGQRLCGDGAWLTVKTPNTGRLGRRGERALEKCEKEWRRRRGERDTSEHLCSDGIPELILLVVGSRLLLARHSLFTILLDPGACFLRRHERPRLP